MLSTIIAIGVIILIIGIAIYIFVDNIQFIIGCIVLLAVIGLLTQL